MPESIDTAFLTALNHIIEKNKQKVRGYQNKLAKKANIGSASYITDLKQGRRYGSEDVRHRIAEAAGYSYEDFLALGGYKNAVKEPPPIYNVPVGMTREITELVKKTVEILKSDTSYAEALAGSIKAFYEAVQKEESQPSTFPEAVGDEEGT